MATSTSNATAVDTREEHDAYAALGGEGVKVVGDTDISGDVVWTADKAWIVTGIVLVKGGTLTIEPGAKVLLGVGSGIRQAGGSVVSSGAAFVPMGDTDVLAFATAPGTAVDTREEHDAYAALGGEGVEVVGDTDISGDVVWTADKTWIVTGIVLVKGGTLTIEPGAKVLLGVGSGIRQAGGAVVSSGAAFVPMGDTDVLAFATAPGTAVDTREEHDAYAALGGEGVKVVGDTDISGDVVWTTDKTWIVTGIVLVKGGTLTIEPGAKVLLGVGSGIRQAGGAVVSSGAAFVPMGDTDVLAFATAPGTAVDTREEHDAYAALGGEGVEVVGDTDISGDVVWTADKTWIVTGIVLVKGGTLTIEPGAKVLLGVGSGIRQAGGSVVSSGAAFVNIAFDGRMDYAEAEKGDVRLDTDVGGLRVAAKEEPIAFSSLWGGGDAAQVKVSYTTAYGERADVVDEAGTAEGEYAWKADVPGYYTFTHTAGGETLSATFVATDPETTEIVFGAEIAESTEWPKGKTILIDGIVTVKSGATLTIAPGAVVKFMDGAGIACEAGGRCVAGGVVFTHVNDDTVGGDTLLDGSTAPLADMYALDGVSGDDATQYRYHPDPTVTLAGTIARNEVWRGFNTYCVTGNVAVASGATLMVEPGAIVKFAEGRSLTVNSGATFNAIGTRAQPIVFTSMRDDEHGGDTNGDGGKTLPYPGDWVKIGVNGGTANFEYASILYSSRNQTTGAINQNGGVVRFVNGEIAHCAYDAVGVESGNLYMTNSVIHDCLLAFRHWAKDPIVNCVVYDCGRLTQGGGQTFVNCVFSHIAETWEAFGFPKSTYRNCCFWNEGGSVLTGEGTQDAMTVCGKDGNVWGDPLFVDPDNGDFRIKEKSPCADIADNDSAPETDYFGQPRVNAPDIGICEVVPRNVTSDIDLVPQSVTADAEAVSGRMLTISWTVANQGGADMDSEWRDTVSLVSGNGREVVLGEKVVSKRLVAGGTVSCSASFIVPALAEGAWYPKVNVNCYRDVFEGHLGGNNALTGTDAVNVSATTLDLSAANSGVIDAGAPTVLKLAFDATNENRMVKLDVPSGVTAAWGFGFMPGGTRSSASGTATASDGGVMFRVPGGATDVYVVLESDATATYNLTTESTKMTIAGVSPATLPASGTTTLAITGAGFGETNEVALVGAAGRVVFGAPQKDASGNLVATVDCAKLAAGKTYDLAVTSGDDSATLPGAVAVSKAEGKGILELEYDVPSSVRPGRVFTVAVTYANVGNKDMCVPLLTVQDTGNDAKNPIEFSLDGARFTAGGLQFMGTDASGGFGALHPGDEVALHVQARIPAANNGSTAVSVRSNTESDIMAKYTTEIDRYLTPRMKEEFASTTDDELKTRGERMQQVFGANNGEMVQNFASLAKRFYECNGFALQKVGDLMAYGSSTFMVENEPNGDSDPDKGSNVNVVAKDFKKLLSVASLDSGTGAYFYKNRSTQLPIDMDNPDLLELPDFVKNGKFSLAGKRIALVAHGWKNSSRTSWVLDMAHALSKVSKNGKKLFDGVILVNWEKEARDSYTVEWGGAWIPICASSHIDEVANRVAGQLKDAGLDGSLCTFIGHSFGAHLSGQVASRLGGIRRHIGLDTANTLQVWDDMEVSKTCAGRTEYYRSSRLAGRTDAYAHYNFIVVPKNGFHRTNILGTIEDHSYSHQWLIENIEDGESSGVGFWFDPSATPCPVVQNVYAGVINGDEQKLECIYPYENGSDPGYINYPGNKKERQEIYKNWLNVRDQTIQTTGIEDNEDVLTGEELPISVMVENVIDVTSLTQSEIDSYRLTIDIRKYGDADWQNLVDVQQENKVFNLSPIIPHGSATDQWTPYEMRFEVSSGSNSLIGGWDADDELYSADNKKTIVVNVRKGDKPIPNVNGASYSGFVLKEKPITYESQEAYDKACAEKRTFKYVFDASKSRVAQNRKIDQYMWIENGTVVSRQVRFEKNISATTAASYPIKLVVMDDLGVGALIEGKLDVTYAIEPPGQPIEQPRSYDPNEMRGPLGSGDPETERFVKPGEWLTYTVYFENVSNATAAAQEVYVTNPLSEWLDWSTFEMGEIAFGNQIDLGLSGKSGGTSEATMAGTNFLVRTTLALEANGNAGTRQAKWYLRIVDPSTDTGWPTDVLAGFLPPNDETFRGEGHLTYRVKVRDDAPANVVITNSASIVFDYNDPIETDPAWWNTVAPKGAQFIASEVAADEGGTATVGISGGNADAASSVKVYLAYNTATAADVDLKAGTVDGETPKGGLKFPLTLNWAAGETGEKTIAIPIKTDKTIENDEFFTLQLGDAQGMEISPARVCIVAIRDPGRDDLAAKIASGVATKAETNTWNKLQAAKAPYIRGLADTAERGKVSGSGMCAAGKKVSLKATANKGFVFMGWTVAPVEADADGLAAVDYLARTPGLVVDRTAKPAKDTATSTTFTNIAENVTFYAHFITVEEDKANIALAVNGASLSGASDGSPASTNIVCGVALEWPLAAQALSGTTLKVSGLPAGLKFAAKDVTDPKTKEILTPANTIYGAPTAASKIDTKTGALKPYEVKITVTTAGKSSVTYPLELTVDPLPRWAQGTFTGVLSEVDVNAPGLATLAVSAAGKISGKYSCEGTNWTLSAASFDASTQARRSESGEVEGEFIATLDMKAGKETRRIGLRLCEETAPEAGGDATPLANGSAAVDGFGGALNRTMWKDKESAATAKSILSEREGLYTASIDAGDGMGYGYLSLTLGKDGMVKAAGKLADGTSLAASSPLVYDGAGYIACIYAAPAAYKGGWFAVRVRFGEPRKGVSGGDGFTEWCSRNPQAGAVYGEGFARDIALEGAYYDKLSKLRDYYESLEFAAPAPELAYTYKETAIGEDGKKTTVVTGGSAKAANAADMAVAIDAKGTAFIAPKATKPVQDKETGGWLYEGENDGALALSFTPATGVFKGSFTFWYDYLSAFDAASGKETAAHVSKKANFEGIMVQWAAEMRGFYLWDAEAEYEDPKTGKIKTYKYKQSFPAVMTGE